MTEPLDWTRGGRGLAYQRCPSCGTVAYFRRSFCSACGRDAVEMLEASGRGTIYAITTVSRAPTPDWKALAPYRIALVDAEEGFRFMAHAAQDLAIGDPVTTGYRDVGGGVIPLVEPAAKP